MSTRLLRMSARIGNGHARNRLWYRAYSPFLVLSPLLAGFVIAALWQWIMVIVPAGHVGVKWHLFGRGTDTQIVYAEGSHFTWPWNRMAVYDARLQQFSRDFDVLTREGLMMTVNIAARYRLNDEAVGLLHKHVGPEYVETLLVPTVSSFARIIFSQNSTEAVYTDRRVAVQAEIKQAVTAELDRYLGQQDHRRMPWLYLDDVLIRSMRFPPEIQSAVNRKMAQYQLREEYAYRLQREELESQRKEIEAQGIAQFQRIVGAGISDNYLRWKGIDATLALAQSTNAKIVVIGTGSSGMPLILGGLDYTAPAGRTDGEPVHAAAADLSPKAEMPLHDSAPAAPRLLSDSSSERREATPQKFDVPSDTLQELGEAIRREAVGVMHLPVPEASESSKIDEK